MTSSINAPYQNRDYVVDVALFRQDFRRYLRALDDPPALRSPFFGSTEDQMAHDAMVLGKLYADGWNLYGWPQELGGLGGGTAHRAVYYEELGRAMVAIPAQHWTLEVMVPALVAYAPDLARKYVPNCLAGEEWWALGFSERDSGSDLASLRTRAAGDGSGGFIVNGQKIWISHGGTAKRLFVLVRTGEPDSRDRGLTMLFVDSDTPGITVRPIKLAGGREELAEVLFDDVRVPRKRLLGNVGDGWALAMFVAQYERGMYGYAALNKAFTELSRLRTHMVSHGASDATRHRFARLYIEVAAAQARTAATVRRLAHGDTVGSDSSIDKLLVGSAEKAVNDLILDARREWMIAAQPGAFQRELAAARTEWWHSRAATIVGGAAEVHRGIVADHLGLPKEKR